MASSKKPVRAWAIKDHDGHIFLCAIRRVCVDAWAAVGYDTPEKWASARNAGYRAVRVRIEEEQPDGK